MKKRLKKIFIIVCLVIIQLCALQVNSDGPPPPPQPGSVGDEPPEGASSSIGGGLLILLTLSFGYGLKRLYDYRHRLNE